MAQSISFAILACNEYYELHKLVDILLKNIREDDEIVVLLDTDNVTDDVKALCKDYSAVANFHYHYGQLKKNFADHKNHLDSLCSKTWIFNIDADEYPTEMLIKNIHDILEMNIEADLIAVPRVNKVTGLTQEHIDKWGWRVDEYDRVNWPDFQLRIYKNVSYIKWEGKVHEKPVGWKTATHFPYHDDDLSLIHIKNIERQEKQNALYNTI